MQLMDNVDEIDPVGAVENKHTSEQLHKEADQYDNKVANEAIASEGAKLTDRQAELEKAANRRANENASENAYRDQANNKKKADLQAASFVGISEEDVSKNYPSDKVAKALNLAYRKKHPGESSLIQLREEPAKAEEAKKEEKKEASKPEDKEETPKDDKEEAEMKAKKEKAAEEKAKTEEKKHAEKVDKTIKEIEADAAHENEEHHENARKRTA